jgi:hypothetical protein
MIQTLPSSLFSDFIRFWQNLGGRLPDAGNGARPDEIRLLEQLARYPLPPFYAEFLLHFGQIADIFPVAEEGSSQIESILRWYQDQERVDRWEIPPGCIVVGVPGITTVGHALVVETPGEPAFVATVGGDILYTQARTFVNALYSSAFSVQRFRFPVSFSLFKEDRSSVSEVTDWALNMGFQSYWFSDEYQAILEREDAIIYAFSEVGGTRVFLQGDPPNKGIMIGEALAKDIGMHLFVSDR